MTTITMQIYIYVDAAWLDVTDDTFTGDSASAVWGMTTNKPTDFVAKTGTMNFTLKNRTGKYLPGGASVISPDWDKGTKVKAVFTYGGQSYIRFYGVVNKLDIIKIPPDNSNVRVSCVDWMDYAAKFPIQNPAIQLDKRMDEAMTTIVDAMAIQPLARDFSTGLNVFPTVFNDATQFTLGLSEFNKLATSEMAYIYVKKDPVYGETLRAESAGSRVASTPVKKLKVNQSAGFLLQENGDKLLQENGDRLLLENYALQDALVNDTMTDIQVDHGDNLINRIVVSVNPTKIAEKDTLLFNLASPIYFDPEAENTFNVQFVEESSKRLVAALPPESSYPTSLMHFDEAPQTGGIIKDESGKTWNDFGLDLSSSVKKFGARSLYFDGTDAYAYAPSSESFEFGSGDFTVEWWEYRFSATANLPVIRRSTIGSFLPWSFGVSDGTNSLVYISSNGSSYDIANGKTWGAITLNTWTHYAISKVDNTYYMHKNGTLTDTWTSSATILASTNDLYLGSTGTCITACIDEMRITKGLGRYTSDFVVANEPFSLSGLVFSAWDNENGEGTELTSDFTVSITYGAAGATVTISNDGAVGGWLTDLKIFGKIVESTSKLSNVQEDTASITQYSEHELVIDQIYQQDFTSGREEAAKILQANKHPLVKVNSIAMNANRDEAHTRCFLDIDVGDTVSIIEPVTETNADFFIQGVNWRARPGDAGSVIVDFGWIVKKSRERVEPLAVSFPASSPPKRVEFGYVAAVAEDNVPSRIWSTWAYLTTSATNFRTIVLTYNNDDRGYYIFFNSRLITVGARTGNEFYTRRSSTTFPNTPDTWMHFLVKHDVRGGSARFFCNGVDLGEGLVSASGQIAVETEVGTNLSIGRSEPATGTKIKDFRIYNAEQVADPAALALALYNEGAHGKAYKTGLLFRTFYVPTDELSDYEGASLTEDMKITDDVGRAVGTPVNTPSGEAI